MQSLANSENTKQAPNLVGSSSIRISQSDLAFPKYPYCREMLQVDWCMRLPLAAKQMLRISVPVYVAYGAGLFLTFQSKLESGLSCRLGALLSAAWRSSKAPFSQDRRRTPTKVAASIRMRRVASL